MEDRTLDWLILGLLPIIFVLLVFPFIRAIGQAELVCFGWLAVLVGVVVYARLAIRQPQFERKVVDGLLILIAAGTYALIQTTVMIAVLMDDRSALEWMIPLALILCVIGLGIYKLR